MGFTVYFCSPARFLFACALHPPAAILTQGIGKKCFICWLEKGCLAKRMAGEVWHSHFPNPYVDAGFFVQSFAKQSDHGWSRCVWMNFENAKHQIAGKLCPLKRPDQVWTDVSVALAAFEASTSETALHEPRKLLRKSLGQINGWEVNRLADIPEKVGTKQVGKAEGLSLKKAGDLSRKDWKGKQRSNIGFKGFACSVSQPCKGSYCGCITNNLQEKETWQQAAARAPKPFEESHDFCWPPEEGSSLEKGKGSNYLAKGE